MENVELSQQFANYKNKTASVVVLISSKRKGAKENVSERVRRKDPASSHRQRNLQYML